MNTKLTLTIDSGDAAFATADDARAECVRLLRKVAQQLEDGHDDGPMHDINGNRCGVWSFDPPEPEDDSEEAE